MSRHAITIEQLAGQFAEAHIASSFGQEHAHKRLIARIALDTLKPTLLVFSPYDNLILETESLAEAIKAYNREAVTP